MLLRNFSQLTIFFKSVILWSANLSSLTATQKKTNRKLRSDPNFINPEPYTRFRDLESRVSVFKVKGARSKG